jgi:hypothetical protein
VNQEKPTKLLGVSFADDEFHILNGQARKHKMPVRDFVEYMLRLYINSIQKQQLHKGT